jgi:hypothetical protein
MKHWQVTHPGRGPPGGECVFLCVWGGGGEWQEGLIITKH